MAKINESKRVLVGDTADPEMFQVWHPVMGKKSPPKFVRRENVMATIQELLDIRNKQAAVKAWKQQNKEVMNRDKTSS